MFKQGLIDVHRVDNSFHKLQVVAETYVKAFKVIMCRFRKFAYFCREKILPKT